MFWSSLVNDIHQLPMGSRNLDMVGKIWPILATMVRHLFMGKILKYSGIVKYVHYIIVFYQWVRRQQENVSWFTFSEQNSGNVVTNVNHLINQANEYFLILISRIIAKEDPEFCILWNWWTYHLQCLST